MGVTGVRDRERDGAVLSCRDFLPVTVHHEPGGGTVWGSPGCFPSAILSISPGAEARERRREKKMKTRIKMADEMISLCAMTAVSS